MNTSPTVLIVDDDRGMRETLRVILGPGHRYAFAENVYEAERVLRHDSIDLVLLDLKMPGGSGTDLLPSIRVNTPDTDVIIITAYGTYEDALQAFQHKVAGFIEKDFAPAELQHLVEDTLNLQRHKRLIGSLRERLNGLGETLTARLQHLVSEDHQRSSQRRGWDLRFFRTLADVLESQDLLTAGHSIRVSRLAVAVGRRLDFADEQLGKVELASYLHDLGKIGINKTTLNKEGEFTRLERVEVERHPVLGADILRPLGFSPDVIHGVRHHHERLDGSGYPDGLRADAIGSMARVIAVVDSFDAMTWPRLYRPIPLAPLTALAALEQDAPRRYDTDVVSALREAIEAGEVDLSSDPIRQRRRGFSDGTKGPADDGTRGVGPGGIAPLPAPADPASKGSHEMHAMETPLGETDPGPLGRTAEEASLPTTLMRVLYRPLAGLYASVDGESPMPVIRYPSGGASVLDPETDAELPLDLSGNARFYELCTRRALVPFHALPNSLTANPEIHLAIATTRATVPVRQQRTDGRDVWTTTLYRERPGAPIRHSLRRGAIQLEVADVALQDSRLRGCMDPPVWASIAPDIRKVNGWLRDLADELLATPETRIFRTHNPLVQLHGLGPATVGQLVDRFPACEPLKPLLLGDAEHGGPGAVWVRLCVVDDHEEPSLAGDGGASAGAHEDGLDEAALQGDPGTWVDAHDGVDDASAVSSAFRAELLGTAIESLPVFTPEMHAVRASLARRASNFGELLDADRVDPMLGTTVAVTRLQTALWRFERCYHALLLGHAIAELLDHHRRRGFQRVGETLAGEFEIGQLPLLTPQARRVARASLGSLDSRTRLDQLPRGMIRGGIPGPDARRSRLGALRDICLACESHATALALTALGAGSEPGPQGDERDG